jgi:integrase
MARRHLTDRVMRSLRTNRVQEDVYDTGLKGFGVRVSRAGTRTFFVRYRAAGQNRRLQLGSYPEMSLGDARDRARAALGDVARDLDPMAKLGRGREGVTFGDLASEYLERHAKRNKRSWKEDQGTLDRDLLPAWCERKADSISRAEVHQVLDAVVGRGAPVMANRVLAVTRRVFNWGLRRDLVERNPCAGIKRPTPETRRDRVLAEREIEALWRAWAKESQPIRAAFCLLLLTAQRMNEVLSMRWDQIHGDLWTIPGESTKVKRAHSVPLSAEAQSILAELERSRGEQWVMPSPRQPGARLAGTSLAHAGERIRRALGFEWRPHDLRRTAASHMAAAGLSRFVIARILNHADSSVTAVYDRHSYLPEMREALARWGRRVGEIVGDGAAEGLVEALPTEARRLRL